MQPRNAGTAPDKAPAPVQTPAPADSSAATAQSQASTARCPRQCEVGEGFPAGAAGVRFLGDEPGARSCPAALGYRRRVLPVSRQGQGHDAGERRATWHHVDSGGNTKRDEYFGDQVVFYGAMVADVSIAAAAGTTDVPLQITYQGLRRRGPVLPAAENAPSW
jgi:hypothetical protein